VSAREHGRAAAFGYPRAAGFAALGIVLGAIAAWDLRIWLGRLWTGRSGGDFAGYYLAGLVGRAHGWPGIYDMSLYPANYEAYLGSPVFGNLPLAAWAALPFTVLPFHVADVLWSLLLAAAFVWTWWAATPPPALRATSPTMWGRHAFGWERLLLLLAAMAAYPVLFAIDLGQLVLVVAALLVLHWKLLRAGHPVLAGIAAGLAFIKPQDAALVPLVLLLSGRWKAAAACAVTVAVMAAAVLGALGADGLHGLRTTMDFSLADQFSIRHTLGAHLPGWLPQLPVRAVIALVALVPALAAGARHYERALMAGVLGALLITPYLNAEDLTLLFVCAWLVLGAGASEGARLGLLVCFPFVAFENLIGPVPLVAVELAWLAVLAADSLGLIDRRTRLLRPAGEGARQATPLPGGGGAKRRRGRP
jgi:hypothetical protein